MFNVKIAFIQQSITKLEKEEKRQVTRQVTNYEIAVRPDSGTYLLHQADRNNSFIQCFIALFLLFSRLHLTGISIGLNIQVSD